jgi:hypothetical protein
MDVGIITQCTHLELCRFHNIDGEAADDIVPTVTLSSLHSLDFFARSPSVAFIRALTLPGLRVLALTQAEWTAPVLVALHARSHFRLESLTLTNLLIELDDFTLFLRLLPTLQDLRFESCECTHNGLFILFTYVPGSSPHIVLPNLRTLTIEDTSDYLDGAIVADMVESLPQQVGELNAPFPLINSIHLSLDGPKFMAAVEERLASLSSTGFLVDKFGR